MPCKLAAIAVTKAPTDGEWNRFCALMRAPLLVGCGPVPAGRGSACYLWQGAWTSA